MTNKKLFTGPLCQKGELIRDLTPFIIVKRLTSKSPLTVCIVYYC